MLDGVAALVRGDPDGGDGGAVVDPLRKMDDIGAGIVVIGQFARDLIDPDIGKPVVIEDLAGDLGGGASPHAADLGIFGVGGFDPELRPERQQKSRQHQQVPGVIEAIVVVHRHGGVLLVG